MIELKLKNKWVNSGGNRVFRLSNIKLTFNQGAFISIMNPSGTCKSALLNVIGMLDEFNESASASSTCRMEELRNKLLLTCLL